MVISVSVVAFSESGRYDLLPYHMELTMVELLETLSA